jgi:hypothetical protein
VLLLTTSQRSSQQRVNLVAETETPRPAAGHQPHLAPTTSPDAWSVSIVTRSSLKSWVTMSPGWICRTDFEFVICIASWSVGFGFPTSF